MPKTETKTRKPAGDETKTTTNGKAATNGTKNSNGKPKEAKPKIPIYKTLPPETNPEILRANRLLVKAAAAIRAHNEQQRLLEQQEQERQGES